MKHVEKCISRTPPGVYFARFHTTFFFFDTSAFSREKLITLGYLIPARVCVKSSSPLAIKIKSSALTSRKAGRLGMVQRFEVHDLDAPDHSVCDWCASRGWCSVHTILCFQMSSNCIFPNKSGTHEHLSHWETFWPQCSCDSCGTFFHFQLPSAGLFWEWSIHPLDRFGLQSTSRPGGNRDVSSMFSLVAELLSPDVSGLNLGANWRPRSESTPRILFGKHLKLPSSTWLGITRGSWCHFLRGWRGESAPRLLYGTHLKPRGESTPQVSPGTYLYPPSGIRPGNRSGMCFFPPSSGEGEFRTPSPPRDAPQASRGVHTPGLCLGRTSTLLPVSDRASLGRLSWFSPSGEASPHPVSSTGRTLKPPSSW